MFRETEDHAKDSKMVLDAALFSTQHDKVKVK